MHANSRPIISTQTGAHDQLLAQVDKHAATLFRKPIASYNRDAFEACRQAWRSAGGKPMILDAGCGVGWSTLLLARRFTDHIVIGVDPYLPAASDTVRVMATLSDETAYAAEGNCAPITPFERKYLASGLALWRVKAAIAPAAFAKAMTALYSPQKERLRIAAWADE